MMPVANDHPVRVKHSRRSLRKAERKQQAQGRYPGVDSLYRRKLAAYFSKFMLAEADKGTYRTADAERYRRHLESYQQERQEWQDQQAFKARRAAEAEAVRTAEAIPAEHLLTGWDWRVSFEVYKPKKQKKLWHDKARLTAGTTPDEVKQAVLTYCQQHGWELRQVYGAEPLHLAFAIDRRALDRRVNAGERRLIVPPLAFGQQEPPAPPAKARRPKQAVQPTPKPAIQLTLL